LDLIKDFDNFKQREKVLFPNIFERNGLEEYKSLSCVAIFNCFKAEKYLISQNSI